MASFRRRRESNSVPNFAPPSSSLFIHEDILIDILSRLPVNSLARFSCVCKTWRSIIRHNSSFVTRHLTHSTLNTKGGNLAVTSHIRSDVTDTDNDIYLDVFTDGAFDAPKYSVKFQIPSSHWRRKNIIGSNNGLFCIHGCSYSYHSYLIWNPAMRQFREIPKLGVENDTPWGFLGFGVDAETKDYKLISLHPHYIVDEYQNHICLMRCHLYSKSTGLWRNVDATALTTTIHAQWHNWAQIQIKGVLYWVPKLLETTGKDQIMEFDIREEKFLQIALPNCTSNGPDHLVLGELTEIEGSLALITCDMYSTDPDSTSYEIWMMNEHGDKAWVRKFTKPSMKSFQIQAWKNYLVEWARSQESDDPKWPLLLSLLRLDDGPSSSVVQQIRNLSVSTDGHYTRKVHRYVESLTPV